MYRSILVATDGSELSEKAVKAALRMGRDMGARVRAVHVQAPYHPPPVGELPPAFADLQEDYERTAQAESQRILDGVASMARDLGVECDTEVVVGDAVCEAIIGAAKSHRSDLIVMASHGRRGIRGLLLGSEVSKLLAHCQIPVLVHR